jgi:hypothetical protein
VCLWCLIPSRDVLCCVVLWCAGVKSDLAKTAEQLEAERSLSQQLRQQLEAIKSEYITAGGSGSTLRQGRRPATATAGSSSTAVQPRSYCHLQYTRAPPLRLYMLTTTLSCTLLLPVANFNTLWLPVLL